MKVLNQINEELNQVELDRVELKEKKINFDYKINSIKSELKEMELSADIEIHINGDKVSVKAGDLLVKQMLGSDTNYFKLKEDLKELDNDSNYLDIDLRKNLIKINFLKRKYEILMTSE